VGGKLRFRRGVMDCGGRWPRRRQAFALPPGGREDWYMSGEFSINRRQAFALPPGGREWGGARLLGVGRIPLSQPLPAGGRGLNGHGPRIRWNGRFRPRLGMHAGPGRLGVLAKPCRQAPERQAPDAPERDRDGDRDRDEYDECKRFFLGLWDFAW
jgi:hypothetical protein